MNPPSRILELQLVHSTLPAGKATGILLLSFGPTFLCLQTLPLLTPGAVSVSIYVLKSYLIISLWVSSHYKAYLCLIIFTWHSFLLKFPSLLLYPVCILGKGKYFSFKWQFCNWLLSGFHYNQCQLSMKSCCWNMVASSGKNLWLRCFYTFISALDRTGVPAGWHIVTSRWHPRAVSRSPYNLYSKSSLPWKLITQPKLWKGQVTLTGKSKQGLLAARSLKELSFAMTAFPSFRNSLCLTFSLSSKVGAAHHTLLFNTVCFCCSKNRLKWFYTLIFEANHIKLCQQINFIFLKLNTNRVTSADRYLNSLSYRQLI